MSLMLRANRGSGKSVDCPAKTVDPRFAQQSMDSSLSAQSVDPRFAQHKVRRRKLKRLDAIAERHCHRPRKAMLGIRI